MKTGFILKYKRPQDSKEKPEYVVRDEASTEFTNKRSEATLFKTKDAALTYLDDHSMNRRYWFSFKTTVDTFPDFSSDRKRNFRPNSLRENNCDNRRAS